MEAVYQLLAIVSAVLICWLIYTTVKGQPNVFSRANMSKSLTSMGLLALVLMAFVALLILSVR